MYIELEVSTSISAANHWCWASFVASWLQSGCCNSSSTFSLQGRKMKETVLKFASISFIRKAKKSFPQILSADFKNSPIGQKLLQYDHSPMSDSLTGQSWYFWPLSWKTVREDMASGLAWDITSPLIPAISFGLRALYKQEFAQHLIVHELESVTQEPCGK